MPTRREVDRAGRTYSQWEFKKGVPVDLGVPMGGQDHKTAWAKKKKGSYQALNISFQSGHIELLKYMLEIL